jgi:DNA-binding NtrC family response regulator
MRPAAHLAGLLGESPGVVAVRDKVERLLALQRDARRPSPVLIEGETGTGKGLLARAFHRAGPRRNGPFVEINCAAIPETLLEAELFGHERGAFTDARQGKPGLFQVANHGTLFLDEIGLLPEGLQGKLLSALEERSVRRLGSTRSEAVDVWILAATNEDLQAATRTRRFREDLYHRLAVLTLTLPPLRERGHDIRLLAEHFLACLCNDYDMPPKQFTDDACAALLAYSWPGNVRELSNVIERVVLLSDARQVTAEMLDLPEVSGPRVPGSQVEPSPTHEGAAGAGEADRLLGALQRCSWNISRAATDLGLTRNTLRYRIEKYRLRPGSRSPRRPEDTEVETERKGPTAPLTARETTESESPSWEGRRLALLRAVLVPPAWETSSIESSKHLRVLVDKIESFGGRVEEMLPSAVVGAFGLEPVEDAPRRAVLAAVAIQRAAELGSACDDGEGFEVRIGIHIGHVLLGRVGGHTTIHPDSRQEAWKVLDGLVSGEPGRILIETSGARPRRLAGAPFFGQPFPVASEADDRRTVRSEASLM